MTTPTNIIPMRRQGIAMSLDDYERWAKRFVAENYPAGEQLLEEMRLSKFILWLRQHRQEIASEIINRRLTA